MAGSRRAAHHDLCFGCGLANVFGLHLEVQEAGLDRLEARFFAKQDHQGPDGRLHPGVLGAALQEAMALLLHVRGAADAPRPVAYAVELHAAAAIGTFVHVRVQAGAEDGDPQLRASASTDDGALLARASGRFAAGPGGHP